MSDEKIGAIALLAYIFMGFGLYQACSGSVPGAVLGFTAGIGLHVVAYVCKYKSK